MEVEKLFQEIAKEREDLEERFKEECKRRGLYGFTLSDLENLLEVLKDISGNSDRQILIDALLDTL